MIPEPSKKYPLKSDEQIAWILAHPAMSPWLKQALRTARERDPNAVLNDLEVLRHVMNSKISDCMR
ncbi:hypothetical protein [Sphingopyxis solisilvae]|jgi:hypothetical protein|uniref:hypothetical protein n=1 Tax=Sphingopyxis solisilvae TaxID=1886788 RepID=UPI0018928B8D|nr:hypothetical protein [Sphingopyxis solisilvae]